MGDMNDPVYMHIKDLRTLLGLSENGFRFYETKGIIKPFRDEDNGYRVMYLSDGLRLFDAYGLTRFGLSIKQADDVLSGSTENAIGELEGRSQDMSQELQRLLAQKEQLDRLIRILREYEQDPGRCVVTDSASLVFLPVHYQDMSLNREAYNDGPSWWKAAPLVNAGLLVTLGSDRGGIDGAHGPTTSERVAQQWQLPMDHAIRFCHPGEKYLRFYTKYPAGELPRPDDYMHAFVYLATHGLEIKGDQVMHRMLRHVVENGTPMRLDETFMPVVDIE